MVIETGMKINNSSQELFQEAVRTLHLQPEYAEISMVARGVSLPKRGEEAGEAERRYISECVENNIIPFSESKLYYGRREGLFVPRAERGIDIRLYEELSDQGRKEAVDMMLKGGKPSRIKFEMEQDVLIHPVQTGFSFFRGEFLDTMVHNGYQLEKGDLWLSQGYSHQHYSEGYRRGGGLSFDVDGIRKGLELQLPRTMPEEDNKKLVGWFNALKEKYD